MLSLDLFDSKYERRLHEGAVDNTIEHLLKPLSLRAAEIRTQLRSGRLDPKQIDRLEKEYEDLVQKRLDIILDRRPQTEQQQPQTPVKGQDLVTPQQRVAAATPPRTSMMGKARETFASFANWLAGKDDTGPTYETRIRENDQNSAINAAKYVYTQLKMAHDQNVDMASIRWMGGGDPVTMSRNQIYHTLIKLQDMSRQNRNAFAVQTLANRNNFYLWLGSQKKVTPRPQLKQPSNPQQPELPLGKPKISPVQERDQKKKSDDIQAQDVKVARELQKLRAKYPAAASDVEAVARAEIDSSERSQQQIAAIRGANEKQDALLRQLVSLDQEQGREIDDLDKENNSLEQQLARIQSTNDRLQQTLSQMTGTKRSSRAKKPSTPDSTTKATATPTMEPDPMVANLAAEIQRLRSQPATQQNQEKLANLDARLSQLQAQFGELSPGKADATDRFGDLSATMQKIQKPPSAGRKTSLTPRAPSSDLDIKPKTKKAPAKSKTNKATQKQPKATDQDAELDYLDLEQPVSEHGGGIGPRQHWQDLMPEQSNPEDDDWYDEEDDRLKDGDYVRDRQDGEFGEIFRMSGDPTERRVRILDRDGRGWYISPDRLEPVDPADPDIQRYFGKKRQRDMDESGVAEGWSDAMVARRTGGPRTPYAVYIDGRQWKVFSTDDHAQAVADKVRANLKRQGRDQTVTIAPSEDYLQGKIKEEKQISSKEDFVRERDRLLRMITQETNPANKQILRTAIRQLESRAENEGWLTMQQRMVREDNASGAAEQAILKRIMVAHTDLLKQYGPEKVMQAAEEVAYNVGDLGEIGSSDVSGWVRQVEQILGARP